MNCIDESSTNEECMKHLLKLIIVKFANYWAYPIIFFNYTLFVGLLCRHYYFNLYNNIINYLYTRK